MFSLDEVRKLLRDANMEGLAGKRFVDITLLPGAEGARGIHIQFEPAGLIIVNDEDLDESGPFRKKEAF